MLESGFAGQIAIDGDRQHTVWQSERSSKMQNQRNANNYTNAMPMQMQQQHQQHQQQLQIMIHPPDSMPKNSGVDRLARRMNDYRQHHNDCGRRFDETFNGACQQQTLETTALQKRFLENKAKKAVKKTDKRQPDTILTNNLHSSVHVQQKVLKRPADGPDNNADGYEPSHKISHTGSGENLKFSVEIVQQLEFTTSVANAQPQQISTNVTVKALTNTSIRNDGQANASGPSTTTPNCDSPSAHCNNDINPIKSIPAASPASHHSLDVSNNLVQCKQEPDIDLDDLAYLSDLINDTPDTLNELISDLQSDFDFEEKPALEIKTENGSGRKIQQQQQQQQPQPQQQFQPSQHHHHYHQQQQHQQMANAQHQQLSHQQRANVYNGSNNSKVPICELSPAQTLKHMAEQHQHKNTMGMQFTRSPIHQNAPHQKQIHMNRPVPNGATAFPNDFNKFNVNEFINNSVQFNKMLGAPAGMDNNMIYAHHQHQQQQQQKNQQQLRKSHYSQYNDGLPPSDLSLSTAHTQPRNNTLSTSQQHTLNLRGNLDQFVSDEQATLNGGANLDSNNDSQSTTLQMKQTQQMNIIQQGPNPHNIHVSAGQHMHLRTDMKSNINVSAQQAMYFSQQHSHMNRSPSGGAGFSNDPKNCHNTPQQQQQHSPHMNTQNCPTDPLMVNQMQSMEFTAHQAMHQKTHKQKQKLQPQAVKIKQEPRNQAQHIAANQSPFRQGAAGRGVGGTPSPNSMMPVMNHSMNMNISSPPMMSDSSVDSVGGGNAMPTMTNTSIKAMMSQSMCHKSSSNANAMNQNMNNNALGSGMGQNGANILNNIDMSTGMTTNPNPCSDMDANDVSSLMRHDQNKLLQQQQQQILRNKTMNMSGIGARPPPPEYKGNTMMTNQMIQQSNGNQQNNHRQIDYNPWPVHGR